MILTYVLPGLGRVPQLAVPICIQVRLFLRLLAPSVFRPLRQPRGSSLAHGTIFINGCAPSAWMSVEKWHAAVRLDAAVMVKNAGQRLVGVRRNNSTFRGD